MSTTYYLLQSPVTKLEIEARSDTYRQMRIWLNGILAGGLSDDGYAYDPCLESVAKMFRGDKLLTLSIRGPGEKPAVEWHMTSELANHLDPDMTIVDELGRVLTWFELHVQMERPRPLRAPNPGD